MHFTPGGVLCIPALAATFSRTMSTASVTMPVSWSASASCSLVRSDVRATHDSSSRSVGSAGDLNVSRNSSAAVLAASKPCGCAWWRVSVGRGRRSSAGGIGGEVKEAGRHAVGKGWRQEEWAGARGGVRGKDMCTTVLSRCSGAPGTTCPGPCSVIAHAG
eukprot:365259-Chlamydomonas_euryale.AAC.11